MSLWYFETMTLTGRWSPNTALIPPQVSRKKGRPDRIGGDTGPRIRHLVEIAPDHHRLPLDQLAAIYGTKEPLA